MNPDIISNVKYSPPVSKNPVWVPEEKRLIIDIWREVDEHSWLLGDRMLLLRQSAPWDPNVDGCLCTWRDSNDPGSFYALLKASSLLPLKSRPIRPLHDSSPIRLIYDTGGARLGRHASAVWKVGDVYFKIKYTQWTLPKSMAREHTILDALNRTHLSTPLSFAFPKVLYHEEYNDRYYLVTTSVPGSTVRDAWPGMDETARQRCVDRVARICRELASWRSDRIGSVDGTPDERLATWLNPGGSCMDAAPQELIRKCESLGINCSCFVFFHGDLGPTNILLDRTNDDSIGLVDWEYAAFVPESFIPIHVQTSAGYNLDIKGLDKRSMTYAKRLAKALNQVGFLIPGVWNEHYLGKVERKASFKA